MVSPRLAAAWILLFATPAAAQECTDCVLGLYADSLLTQTQILPGGNSLDLYLGIRYGSDPVRELTGVEFSIAGLDSFTAVLQPFDGTALVVGTPASPAGRPSRCC